MKAKILVVDDDPELARSLAETLDKTGYEAIIAVDDAETLYYYDEFQPDLIVLDIRFGFDERMGLDVLREIRELRNDRTTPIIMLTGVSDDELEPRSFEYDATDFVRKSISTKALLARVKARLPRVLWEPTRIDDCIEIDEDSNSVKVKRNDEWQRVHLEPKEYEILMKLVKHAGRVIEREVLEGFFPDSKNPAATLRRYICELRKRLEPDPRNPRYILTERGLGYRFKAYR